MLLMNSHAPFPAVLVANVPSKEAACDKINSSCAHGEKRLTEHLSHADKNEMDANFL